MTMKNSSISMKRIGQIVLCALVTAVGAGCATFSQEGGGSKSIASRPETLVRDRVSFTPAKPERWELPNGLQIFYRYSDELPAVHATLFLPGGSFSLPREKAGLAEATGSQMRDGGFAGMSPELLDKALDDLAASVETGYSQIYGTVGFGSLKEDFPKVLGFASEIVQHPAFNAGRFELFKKNAHQSIDRRKDNPNTMAGLTLGNQVFGTDSLYSSYATHESINKITIEAMRDFHKKYVHPQGAKLVVTGDITKDELNKLLEKTLGQWKASPEAIDALPPPPVPELGKAAIYVIERDFDQSTVVMGHVGPSLPNPEIPHIGVFNRLYGDGGFGNVLMQQIRTKLGLAYGVGGGINPGIGAGLVEIELATRNEEVIRAIEKILEVTKGFLSTPIPEEDLRGAKSAVQRAFIFRFDSPDKVVSRAVQQEILKFPPDYDSRYIQTVEEMTPETVLGVGKKWMHLDNLVIVVVGRVPAQKFEEAFGPKGIPVYRVEFDQGPRILK